MTLSRFAPILPVAVSTLFIVVGGASAFWTVARFRRNGRRAIEQELARRGESPISISSVPLSALPERTGLASGFVYRIAARNADGAETSYMWAYEPALIARQPRALMRLAHGIWIPLT